jgi:magnesium chelatase family protein
MPLSVLVHSAIPAGVGARSLAIRVDVHPSSTPINRRNDDSIVRHALSCLGVPYIPFTVQILPDIPRSCGSIDLAIALALLAAHDAIPVDALADVHVLGRLTMDATIHPVRAVLPILTVLPIVAGLPDDRPLTVLVPRANLPEAQLVDGIILLPADSLNDAIAQLKQVKRPSPTRAAPVRIPDLPRDTGIDALAISPYVRAALDVAAAGNHHVLLMGPHGSGTTWLARRLHSLIPPPSPTEALTITAHCSAAGLELPPHAVVTQRPFRAPHHTVSTTAMIGTSSISPRPGELTLAHHGVLLLDELIEFNRHTLDAIVDHVLRREVTIQHSGDTITMPAAALVVATMTRCLCGRLGHPDVRCICTPEQIAHHHARLTARCRQLFDLFVPLTPRTVFTDNAPTRDDAVARLGRISVARSRRAARAPDFDAAARLTPAGAELLHAALATGTLQSNDRARIVDVGLTIADLAGSELISDHHIEQALAYRLPAHKDAYAHAH